MRFGLDPRITRPATRLEDAVKEVLTENRIVHTPNVRNFLHHGRQRQRALHEVPSARQWPPPRRRLVRQSRIGKDRSRSRDPTCASASV